MANREKKLSLGRKQASASPVPPKETPTTPTDVSPKTTQKTEPAQADDTPTAPKTPTSTPKNVQSVAKKLKPVVKKSVTKNISIKMKAKTRRPIKIKQKIVKTLLNNAKNNLDKKVLLKNGITKVKRPKKTIADNKKLVQNIISDNNDEPPVLEPMCTVGESETKKPKKKTKKITTTDKKFSSSIDETIEEIINQARAAFDVAEKAKKPRKKLKTETNDTIEEVMNDLSHLIEPNSKKSDTSMGADKKQTPQKTVDVRKLFKKENLVNSLDESAKKVIDMLDLNIKEIKNKKIQQRRRHSIEKFPVGFLENIDVPSISQLFSNVPRSISPRSKRALKTRMSSDNSSRRSSPYTTRSESPAHILRNGKHRRLKNKNLLDGLDSEYRKRRRLCSDYSGSEKSVSKLSGYESDSSFSDLASIHGTESNDQKDDVKNNEQEKIPANVVESNGIVEQNFTDTNSNLCSTEMKPLNQKVKTEVAEVADEYDESIEETIKNIVKAESEKIDFKDSIIINAVSKVPDKSIILDIMKQTFNEIPQDDHDKRPTRSSTKRNFKEEPAKTEVINEQTETTQNNVEKPPENDKNVEECKPTLRCNSQEMDGLDTKENESPENLELKENILLALGLRSLKAAEEEKLRNKEKVTTTKNDSYTGTLKTVIKIGRNEKKKSSRNSLKMTLQKNKKNNTGETESVGITGERSYKIMKEAGTSNGKSQGAQSSDTAGAHRKSHYSNRSNMDGSSEHTSDGDTVDGQGEGKSLVIPEKASSFSIHPGRLCKDECSHCFGKFGLFDTPCHIAQMKSVERQDKILASEKHLTRDSCLCDACYRHVDRKSNTPSYTNKSSFKRSNLVAPGPRQNHCHVLGCNRISTNILRRKWIIKMRKSVCQVINIDLNNPGLHSIPICDEHYTALEHLMVCAMCKRRLARNHIHYLGPESSDLNNVLNKEGIPVTLTDKPVVCKLCRYFATLVLKPPEERPDNSKGFFDEYKKRLLHFHDVEVMDESAAEEPIPVPTKEKNEKEQQMKKKKKTVKSNCDPPVLEVQVETDKSDQSKVPSESNSHSSPESPSDYMVDYNTLIPNIALDCGSDAEASKNDSSAKKLILNKIPKPESVKEAVEISKNLKLKSKSASDITVQKLGSNPSISVRQLFPGEEDMQLQAHIDFNNVIERTPEGWEKCTSVIQYDLETKLLWQDLQKPYGNQSSFLRHLILLEKYFRCGDLVLSHNASHQSRNYSESVHNRLRAYDNVPSSLSQISLLPLNKQHKSTSGIITSKETNSNFSLLNAANIPKNIPITISHMQNPNFLSGTTQKNKNPGLPPGLISIREGTQRSAAPLVKVQQKFKFPITKNWRPNLIPIDPNKKPEKKTGLVKVISGGKPYHITYEDYRKMCEIKRNYESKQRKLQEAQTNKITTQTSSSILKTLAPRKSLTISKTSTITSCNSDQPLQDVNEIENSLEKLEAKFASDKSPMLLPKIPKSLTVIPQTVTRKPSRPSSPNLLITPKPKQNVNSS